MKYRFIISFALCLLFFQPFAQDASNIKFGNITTDDLNKKIYSIDSNANAIVIADIGSTKFEGNSKGWFSLVYTRFRRIHILNKNGYDAAKVEIGIYTDGTSEEELRSLKAVTYNLVNGKVEETKLDKSTVFKDKINKHLVVKKFTFPNVKEGSIIEYKYEIHSDFIFNLQPWQFQGAYPTLWSEYSVGMPQFFEYIFLFQGYEKFYLNDSKDRIETYTIAETGFEMESSKRFSITTGLSDHRWAMKDVPALKEESYTSTINNHIAQIQFQLAAYKDPLTAKEIMPTWPEACTELLKEEDFGSALSNDNSWLNDIMPAAIQNAANDLDKAKNIFAYVRDNVTCTNHNRAFMENSLKSVLKTRNGSVAEVNLLLTAMLLKAGLTADPVMLSTRSHGYVFTDYPLMERFNYVITRATINGNYYYLDASEPAMGFDKLGYDCYNGDARVVNKQGTLVRFVADSLLEGKISSVIIIADEKGNLSGTMKQTPGFYESNEIREHIKEKGKDQLFADIKKEFNADVEITNPKIDSLDKYEIPLNISYDFDIKNSNAGILYINPMFSEAWKLNPFKSAERIYPVEMPYTIDEIYLLKIDIPAGYVLDELPKQLKIKLNDKEDGFFEYLVTESNGSISLRSRLRLKRAYYMPNEYQTLRAFFNMIVNKQNEQIVLKKKK